MRVYWNYFLWTTGSFKATHRIPLDWRRTYLVTGFLTLKDGGNYGHIYIATLCRYSGGDQVLCGIRDDSGDADLGINEFISSASSVTVALRTTGGRHRAEGVVYDLS